MRRHRLLAALAASATLLAACTSAGSGGGGYGAPAPVSPAASTVVVAPASAAPLSAAPSSAAGDEGYTKGDYGPGGGSPAVAASTVPGAVRLSGYAFVPAATTVASGSVLTFANDDGVAHDIVVGTGGTPADPAGPHARIAPAGTGSLTMPTSGTVQLTCTIHPSMTMTVTVGP